MNYYNEIDKSAANWIRQLIKDGLMPLGDVDERSIVDVRPEELKNYVQCHFFAGIAGWSYALQLAGWPPDRPVWTGSCPCQPFSTAGKGLGQSDERHLWPAFFNLIRECRPQQVFGEQVASAIGHGWLDGISADLEGEGYACGAAVLGAHSVNAPHIRKRLYWVADANGEGYRDQRHSTARDRQSIRESSTCGVADSERPGLQGHAGDQPGRIDPHAIGSTAESGATGGGVADTPSMPRAQHEREPGSGPRRATGPHDSSERGGDHGRLADADRLHDDRAGSSPSDDSRERQSGELRGVEDTSGRLGNPESRGLGIVRDAAQPGSGGHADGSGESCGLGVTNSDGREPGDQSATPARHGDSSLATGFWSDSRWIYCRDGKHRRIPTEPALFPLADGIPYKLARRGSIRPALLKGAGNAIVPQVAAEFVMAFMEVEQMNQKNTIQ